MSQRRPKDRSHWGEMAFKAMHDKPKPTDLPAWAKDRAQIVEALEAWRNAHSRPDCPACAVLEARLPDPLRVEDLLDGLPRLSTEAEALKAMGAGQALTKMREIK